MNTSGTYKNARFPIKKGLNLIDEAAELNRIRKVPEPSRRGGNPTQRISKSKQNLGHWVSSQHIIKDEASSSRMNIPKSTKDFR
jgi:hypothetical protein